MPHKQIKESIQELKGELQKTPKETSPFEKTLEAAHEGIENYTPEAIQELLHILKREAEEFQVDHPRVTGMIDHVMNSLSNLGI